MADTLDWMNKHLVLLRYVTVDEAVAGEKYEKRPDLEELYEGITNAEAMIYKFASVGRWKCACDLMATVAHKRAAVWWVYRCLLSLYEEFKVNPPVDRDIADIGADFSVKVPDFAQVKPPEVPPDTEAKIRASFAETEAALAKASAKIDPEIMSMVNEAIEVAWKQFEKVHGIHPIVLLKKLAEKAAQESQPIDPASPIFNAADELHSQVEAVRKSTVETIKEAIPPKSPKHEKMLRDNALTAVWRWIAAPDAENSQKCFDTANTCPGTEAGLLAFSAFWSFGDLMPMGQQPVPTPPGLAVNGYVQTLMKCALAKGGTRKPAERYEQYFLLGMDVLTGKENWADSLETGKPPHEALSEMSPASPASSAITEHTETKTPANEAKPEAVKYERWK